MTPFNHLIFDLDGTLDDQMPGHTKAFVSACAKYGLPIDGLAELYNNSAGTPLGQQFAEAFSSQGVAINIENCIQQFWAISGKHHANPFPGAVDLISALYHQQRHLYLTTGSATDNARRRLEEMGIHSSFKLILGGEKECEKGAAHLQRFKEHSQDHLFEQQALYLGDGTGDMRFAQEFGIAGVGLTTTLPREKLIAAGAVYIIESIAEFLPLLEQLEKM